MTVARKPLPPLPVRRTSLPPLPQRATTPDPAYWHIHKKAPYRTGRGVCEACAGRGHFVWHASEHITLDCVACGGAGGTP